MQFEESSRPTRGQVNAGILCNLQPINVVTEILHAV
jgi:hypothetical protein